MMYVYIALVGIPLVLLVLQAYGSAVLHILRISPAHKSLAPITGLAALILTSYLSGYLTVRSLTAVLIGIAIAWYVHSKRWKIDLSDLRNKADKPAIALLIVFSTLFAIFNAFSGIITPHGFEMRGTNSVDGFIHMAYVKNIIEVFPPTRPVFANVPLTGYHYFFPLFAAQINLLFGFSAEDVLFRITPFVLALLYGLSFYLLAQTITTSKTLQRLIILSSYVTYSTLPLIPNLFVGFPGIANPLSFIHNPSTLMAAAFLNAAFYALTRLKSAWGWSILSGILIGILAQTKVYAGMIGLGTLGFYGVVKLLSVHVIPAKAGIHLENIRHSTIDSRFRGNDTIKMLATMVITALVTYLTFFINNAGSGSLVIAPFRFFDHFMEQEAFLSMQWPQRKAIFLTDNNILRIVLLYIQAIVIFLLIHLGTRIFALVAAPALFQKKFWQNDTYILIMVATILSFLIPTFFIQSISVFNIAQTFWTGAALSAIPSALGLHILIKRMNKPIVTTILIALFILPFAITYFRESRQYITGVPDRTLPHDQLELFEYITEKVPPNEFLFFIPAQDPQGQIVWSGTPVFPAMTSRSLYIEFSGTPFELNEEGEKRVKEVETALKAVNQCNLPQLQQLLSTINTKNIVTTKPISCLTNTEFVDHYKESTEYSYYHFR